jgi:Zn-dependent peptidase ImmA (M78 family)/DNA-binding XRE family transcriptional regulator
MLNPQMIILARESRGYTQEDLSNKLSIKQGTLSKIEQGFQRASDDIIKKLSTVLDYPKSFFEQSDNIYNPSLSYYRKKITIPKRDIVNIEANMNIIRMNIERLLNNIEISETNLLNWNVDEDGPPEKAAQFLREKWKISKGRIDNLTKLIEDNGILVVQINVFSNKFDGLSMFTKGNQPIIFINENMPGDRQRLTLAHELGHLVLHFGQIVSELRDTDKEAYIFGSEFLVPLKEFCSNIDNISLKTLANLKRYWKVSMAALLFKANHYKFITSNQYRYIWSQISGMGYRVHEPIELNVPKESPKLVREIINLHMSELDYSEDELASLVHLNVDEFKDKYLNAESKLKILR